MKDGTPLEGVGFQSINYSAEQMEKERKSNSEL